MKVADKIVIYDISVAAIKLLMLILCKPYKVKRNSGIRGSYHLYSLARCCGYKSWYSLYLPFMVLAIPSIREIAIPSHLVNKSNAVQFGKYLFNRYNAPDKVTPLIATFVWS